MGEIIELQPKKHIYELEKCAGCSKEIVGEYLELILPIGDTTSNRHIALCSNCERSARNQGVIN